MDGVLKLFNASIVAFSKNEIIIKRMDLRTLKQFLNSKALGDDSYISERYLKIEEFISKQHKLNSGKKFYAKYFTNEIIPSLKQLGPENKLEALEIVSENWLIHLEQDL
jgi:hypothetical protein